MEQVSLKMGERLKEIRNTRQLTLADRAWAVLTHHQRVMEDFNRAENTVILFLQTAGIGIYGCRAW